MSDACNLSRSDFEQRLADLRRDFLPQVRHQEVLDDGHAFEFGPEALHELRELVAFEQRCCPDLHWSLDERTGGLRLEVRGLDR